mmetsp:Transcript_11284/g.17459  ORF Transcript_11284/g.17459 Transcript_11284/m.17459 type:complete len:215 (-) Transcript_11284:981-1625(-)
MHQEAEDGVEADQVLEAEPRVRKEVRATRGKKEQARGDRVIAGLQVAEQSTKMNLKVHRSVAQRNEQEPQVCRGITKGGDPILSDQAVPKDQAVRRIIAMLDRQIDIYTLNGKIIQKTKTLFEAHLKGLLGARKVPFPVGAKGGAVVQKVLIHLGLILMGTQNDCRYLPLAPTRKFRGSGNAFHPGRNGVRDRKGIPIGLKAFRAKSEVPIGDP